MNKCVLPLARAGTGGLLRQRNLSVAAAVLFCLLLSLQYLNLNYLGIFSVSTGGLSYLLAGIILLVLPAVRARVYAITRLDAAIALFAGILLVNTCMPGRPVHFEYTLNMAIALAAYALVRTRRVIRYQLGRYLPVLSLAWVTAELLWCGLQYAGLLTNVNPLYRVGGSGGHPSFSAGAVAVLLPFLADWVFTGRKPALLRLYAALLFAGAWVLVFYLQSRAGILAGFASTITLVILRYPHIALRRKGRLVPVAALAFAILAVALFYLKEDSSRSRAFIWKTSLAVIGQNPWTGVGLGRFDGAFNRAQHDFFFRQGTDHRLAGRAGHVEIAYNDFIELFVECGLPAFAAWAAVVGFALRTGARQGVHPPFFASFVAFIPFLLTWSILKYPSFTLVLFPVLAVLAGSAPPLFRVVTGESRIWPALRLAAGACVVGCALLLHAAYDSYRQGKLAAPGTATNAVARYANAYPYLRSNYRFLYDYAEVLARQKRYDEALRLLDEARHWSFAPNISLLQGQLHEAAHRPGLAERHYWQAHYTVPSRIYPRFLLAKLYFENGKHEKARLLAGQLIHAPLKNQFTDEILLKEKLRYYLSKHRPQPALR